MSPRAACRFESLGFEEVYDYVGGKTDWQAAELPVEGTQASVLRVGDAARRDIPTCGLRERVADVHQRVTGEGWHQCVVTPQMA